MANETKVAASQFNLPATILEGERNTTIFRYGCHLKFKENFANNEIADLLRNANATRCTPPMETWEIEQTIRNVTKARSGKPIGTGVHTTKSYVPIDPNLSATEQAARQIQAMFSTEDIVSFITHFTRKADGKWAPTGRPISEIAFQIIDKLQRAESLDEVFPGYNKEAGILLCINPMEAGSRKNDGVKVYRSALIEYDDIPKDEQVQRMLNSGLPILSMTDSGNKSIHAVVRVDAKDASGYAKLVKELHESLKIKFGSACDGANKNPSRLTRLAGAQRGEKQQTLLYTEVNTESNVSRFIENSKTQETEHVGKLNANEVGNILIRDFGACLVEGIPAIFNDGKYHFGRNSIFKTVLSIREDAGSHFRNEVLSYIALVAPVKRQADPKYIRFANGILDIDSLELLPNNPNLLLLNEIPHAWNPDASSPLVDAVFDSIAQSNKSIIANLWEMYGLAMYRGHDISRMLLLQGSGANGKSTLLDTLKILLGANNCFSLSIHELGEKFQLVPAMGKLALIGDDISTDYVNAKACATMKKFVTGEEVSDQYKGGETFQFMPYSTLIYSCNEIPRFADASYGFERRVHPIPLSARFTPRDDGYDPHLKQKLSAEECIEYAIVKGIEALRRCRETMDLTPNALSAGMKTDIIQSNDFVKAFLNDAKAEGIDFLGMTNSDAYNMFSKWCAGNGQEPPSILVFSKKLCTYENLTTESSNGTRTYIRRTA